MNRSYIIHIFTFLVIFASTGQLSAQSPSAIRAYINKYKAIALQHEREYGIPASITLAQGILESGAGESRLAREANNHFGIKALGGWNGGVYRAWDDEPQKSRFRVYSSAEESYTDHAKVLKESRYRSLYTKSIYDYRGWANELQRAGYATSKTYANALIGYIDTYQLYAVNGGVKLRPGKIITFTTTHQELVERKDIQMRQDEKSEEEEIVEATTSRLRLLVDVNGVRCTILYPGETLNNVCMKYDISKQHLLAFNEITDEDDLQEGDIVFLEKKMKRYHGPLEYYTVKEGQTLYDVSQQFGIRLSSLAKLNGKSLFASLDSGEKLRLK